MTAGRAAPVRGPLRPAAIRVALAALLLGLPAAGCAGLFAPSGPGVAGWDARLRAALATGRFERALAMVGPDSARAGDELLRLQHEGLVAHYAGEWERSSAALERALAMAEDRYTQSVSRALLSVITSDRVIDYEPPHPERLLLPYYGALNYLRRGDPEEAAVEARRLGRLLGRSLEGDLPATPPDLGRTLALFAAAVFRAAGEDGEAAVARRQAEAFRADGGAAAPAGDGDRPEDAGGEPEDGADPADGAGRAGGEVLVVVERDFVAHREEEALTLFLLPREIRRLRTIGTRAAASGPGDGDDGLGEALELARRVDDRRSRGWRSPGLGAGDADPVLVRVAWPVYRDDRHPAGVASLRVEGAPAGAEGPVARADLSAAVREAYEGRRILDLAKALLRAAAKEALAEAIEEGVGEEDETLGDILGWTARIAGALLERADTRSWHLLPERLELFRLRLPAGTHRLAAEVPGAGTLELGTVEVEPGGVAVVSARAWR